MGLITTCLDMVASRECTTLRTFSCTKLHLLSAIYVSQALYDKTLTRKNNKSIHHWCVTPLPPLNIPRGYIE